MMMMTSHGVTISTEHAVASTTYSNTGGTGGAAVVTKKYKK